MIIPRFFALSSLPLSGEALRVMASFALRRQIHFGPLPDPQRTHLLGICGLLARPELTAAHAAAATQLLRDPAWRPLPLIPSLFFVKPLLLHHGIRLGFPPEHLIEEPPENLHDYFQFLASRYYKRRAAFHQALEALAAASIGPLLLIQGTALAPLYRSPALRLMVDFDLVVPEADGERAAAVLQRIGWQMTPKNFTHAESGANLDLHVPSSVLARTLWQHAQPHPAYPASLGVCQPEPATHLAYLASHTAKHMGDRLWRDLADFALLLENGQRIDIAQEALRHALQHDCAPVLAAILRLMNRWTMPLQALPERLEGSAWNQELELETERHAVLYSEMVTEQLTPVALDLLESFRGLSPQRIFRVARSLFQGGQDDSLRPSGSEDPHLGIRRDPLLGELPPPGSRALQILKWRLLQQALRSRQALRYWRIIANRRRIRRDQEEFRSVHG